MKTTTELLADLVGFDTTSARSNLPLISYVQDYLGNFGVSCDLLPNEAGDKVNLHARIGPAVSGGLILSGHSDCVPTTGETWGSDPYTLTEIEGRLYARGACDMKGFWASALAAVPDILAAKYARPVHLALSFDEEIGCSGVGPLIEFIAQQSVKPAYCLVGEPSLMEPVIGHKGGRAYRCYFNGLPVHSSLAPQGVNAIDAAADLVVHMRALANDLAQGHQDLAYDLTHSTLSTGLISGGTAINIVPAEAMVTFEYRNLAQDDQDAIFAGIKAHAEEVILPRMQARHPQAGITFEPIYSYPAFGIDEGHDFVTVMKEVTGQNRHSKVAYGTEAGLFAEALSIPTLVCGPGSIRQAHRADEYIEIAQLDASDAMIRRLCDRLLS